MSMMERERAHRWLLQFLPQLTTWAYMSAMPRERVSVEWWNGLGDDLMTFRARFRGNVLKNALEVQWSVSLHAVGVAVSLESISSELLRHMGRELEIERRMSS